MNLAAVAPWRLLDPVLAVVFPSRCPACARLLLSPSSGPLCESCWASLPRHFIPACACGRLPSLPGERCARCRRGLGVFSAAASLGPYEGALRIVLHELKYRGRRRVARQLAKRLLESPAVRRVIDPGVVLVPVPLHPRRLRERGFNQSELLAAALARHTGQRLAAAAMVRRRETVAQTGLSAAARRANVSGAFAVRRTTQVHGRRVVLVDDVMTTGATARDCARALRAAGAAEVRLLTVARVG